MMKDDNLHQAFDALRRFEGTHAPRFEQLWRPRPARRSHSSVALAILLLVGITLVVTLHRPQPRPVISAWCAPTDFLLKTPGQELLHSLPDLKGKTQ
jgi:hypothetical protein